MRCHSGLVAKLVAVAAVLLCQICFMTIVRAQGETLALPIGTTALDGRPLGLSMEKPDHVVVLEFFASWCLPCAVEARELERIYRHKPDSNVVIIGIDVRESPSKAKSFAKAQGITYPIVLDDGQIQREYRAYAYPMLVIVGQRTGKRERLEGLKPGLLSKISAAVKSVSK